MALFDVIEIPFVLGSTAVTLLLCWKGTVWWYKKYIPKPTNPIHSSVVNSNIKSLIEMKNLLDEKLITQEEFDEYKKKHLENLKAG